MERFCVAYNQWESTQEEDFLRLITRVKLIGRLMTFSSGKVTLKGSSPSNLLMHV